MLEATPALGGPQDGNLRRPRAFPDCATQHETCALALRTLSAQAAATPHRGAAAFLGRFLPKLGGGASHRFFCLAPGGSVASPYPMLRIRTASRPTSAAGTGLLFITSRYGPGSLTRDLPRARVSGAVRGDEPSPRCAYLNSVRLCIFFGRGELGRTGNLTLS